MSALCGSTKFCRPTQHGTHTKSTQQRPSQPVYPAGAYVPPLPPVNPPAFIYSPLRFHAPLSGRCKSGRSAANVSGDRLSPFVQCASVQQHMPVLSASVRFIARGGWGGCEGGRSLPRTQFCGQFLGGMLERGQVRSWSSFDTDGTSLCN